MARRGDKASKAKAATPSEELTRKDYEKEILFSFLGFRILRGSGSNPAVPGPTSLSTPMPTPSPPL